MIFCKQKRTTLEHQYFVRLLPVVRFVQIAYPCIIQWLSSCLLPCQACVYLFSVNQPEPLPYVIPHKLKLLTSYYTFKQRRFTWFASSFQLSLCRSTLHDYGVPYTALYPGRYGYQQSFTISDVRD